MLRHMEQSMNTLVRSLPMLGLFFELSLAISAVGCSGQGMRTDKTNGTGGVSPGGASGNIGPSVGSGGQAAGANAVTGGTSGSGGLADAGNSGRGGSTDAGGMRGIYDGAAADSAGVGGAGGHIVVGDGGGGAGIDGSRHADVAGPVDGPGIDDAVAAGNDSGVGGSDSGKVADASGMGGDGPGAAEAGRDAPSAGRADSEGPQKPFAVSPQSVDFGGVLVGAFVQVTVTITAAQTLSDLSVMLYGRDLSVDPLSTCTATLIAGETCTVVVNFSTTSAGTGIDSLIVSAAGQTVSVPVQAVVKTPAELLISPPSGQFAAAMNATSSSVVFGIGNGGESASGPLFVVIAGVDAWLFSVVNSTCTSPLAPGGVCMVTLVFNPRVADGGAIPPANATATLIVTDTGTSGSVATAELTGNITGL